MKSTMLQYINYGPRNFIKTPDTSEIRLNWEFFAVMEGSCAPFLNEGGQQPMCTSTLWLFPPWQQYHWVSPNANCLRAVFHIAVLPEVILQNLPLQKFYKTPITASQGKLILKLAKDIHPYYIQPDATYELRLSRLISELCLMVLQNTTFIMETPLSRVSEFRVNKAEAFYRTNLSRVPSVAETAAITGVSPSQLRRIFRQVRKMSPQQAFRSLRLQCACHLLSGTNWTLEAISQKSGFKSLVDFHRAFKTKFKVTPHYWRSHHQSTKKEWKVFTAPSLNTLPQPLQSQKRPSSRKTKS